MGDGEGESRKGALDGVRVLDLTDERAIYGAKLLADLGADVVRAEATDGDPLRRRGPFHSGSGAAPESLWHAFFASSRRFCRIADDETGAAQLQALAECAHVVIACPGGLADRLDLEGLQRRGPNLVVVRPSSFGADGPWKDFLAPDLVAGALGGSVATTGDVDTPPLKTYGELNFALSGAYTAIAALAGLHRVQEGGPGQRVDVPVHECIASCLEHVFMWFWHHEKLPMANGPALPRRGSLHWSNAYVVMPAKGGSMMVTPTPSFDNQLVWLIEKEAQQDLLDPKYQEPENRRGLVQRMMQVLREWVATRDVEELFFEAQEHHSPYGWVQGVERVAANPQLQARDWWTRYRGEGGGTAAWETDGPGAPFAFSETPWRLRPPKSLADVSPDGLGWSRRSPASASPLGAIEGEAPTPKKGAEASPGRPLEGVRILDFTHVLAGPYATRVLADMGADVVKVNSATRAGPNAPDSHYYLLWNRNKRAVSLDMTRTESRALCRRLVETADVVIDNFSVGVLDRWGVGYEDTRGANPGVIYVQMSGMGADGPWSNFVTYAPTIHALSGLTALTGVPGREDIGIGFSYNDHCAGLHGAVAILAALQARRTTGRGQRIDMAQFEVGVNLLGPALLDWFANGRAAAPCGNRLPYDIAAPHECYRCADNGGGGVEDERWIAIACMTDDQWQSLCGVMGNPDWAMDAGLATAEGRVARTEELDRRMGDWARTQDAVELMHRCQAAGVPAGVVQTGADLGAADPQLAHSGFLGRYAEDHPVVGEIHLDRLPLRFSHTPCDEYRRTRMIGEDNAQALGDWLGMTPEEVAAGEQEGWLA